MSEKVKDLLVENMEKIGEGRPVKAAREINRAGFAHASQQYAESRLHDRGLHKTQVGELSAMIERVT